MCLLGFYPTQFRENALLDLVGHSKSVPIGHALAWVVCDVVADRAIHAEGERASQLLKRVVQLSNPSADLLLVVADVFRIPQPARPVLEAETVLWLWALVRYQILRCILRPPEAHDTSPVNHLVRKRLRGLVFVHSADE